MAYTLDTAAAIERIVAAGAEPTVARAIVAEVARADAASVSKADLDAAIASLEVRLVRWIVGAVFGSAGLLFVAIRFTG